MILENVNQEPNNAEVNELESGDTTMLDDLMLKASERGYLTTDDLLAAFPEAEDSMAQLEEIFIQLINQGIEVYADAEEAEEEWLAWSPKITLARQEQEQEQAAEQHRVQAGKKKKRINKIINDLFYSIFIIAVF